MARAKLEGYRVRLLRRHVPASQVLEAGDVYQDGDAVLQDVPAGWWIVRIDHQLHAVPPEVYERDFTAARKADRCCTVCGCTQDDACDGGCSWAADELCSVCADEICEAAGVDAAGISLQALRQAAAKQGITLR